MQAPHTRCMSCEAPIPFKPGAGSRLCPFCGAINLVREQLIAALPLELKIDEIFRLYQKAEIDRGLLAAGQLIESVPSNFRLLLYRACLEIASGQAENAVFSLIDLGGLDAPVYLRADAQAKLAEALFEAGRIGESVEACERCLRLQEGHPAGSFFLAKACLKLGELQRSLQIVQQMLGKIDHPCQTTFPPRRDELLILKAEIEQALGDYSSAMSTLERLISTVTEAPLELLIVASHRLGRYYLEHALSNSMALDVFKIASLMDPENRHGLLDDLRDAAAVAGVDQDDVLAEFSQARQELLSAIRTALDKSDTGQTLQPAMISPEMELVRIASDPDSRVDILDAAAQKVLSERFDRGTLYPLRTIEDFRRWAASWMLRAKVKVLGEKRIELRRLMKLKQSMQSSGQAGPRTSSKVNFVADKRKKTSVGKMILLVSMMIVLMLGLFLVLTGRQFLDEFKGSVIKVECAGEGGAPPCSLHVAAGPEGKKRFERKKHPEGQLQRIWSWWIDQQVHPDGTIVYSLDLPWGHMDAEKLRGCIGKVVEKRRYSFSPVCLGEK